MAGHGDAVRVAPCADLVAERFGEPLGDVIVKMIADSGDFAVRQFPKQFRNRVGQLFAICGAERVRQVICPRQRHVQPRIGREAQRAQCRVVRLVGENRRDRFAEFVAHHGGIAVVGRFDEFADGVRIQCVQIGLVVVPRGRQRQNFVCIPFCSFRIRIGCNPPGGCQTAVRVRHHVVARERPSVDRFDPAARLVRRKRADLRAIGIPIAADGIVKRPGKRAVVVRGERMRRHQQPPRAVGLVFRDQTACRTGRPAILVIQPGEHLLLLGLVHAGADQRHELVAQVRGAHPRPDVHMKPAQPHFFEKFDLPQQFVALQVAVPRPKRGGAVLRRRRAEQRVAELLRLIFGIQHFFCPSFRPADCRLLCLHYNRFSGKNNPYFLGLMGGDFVVLGVWGFVRFHPPPNSTHAALPRPNFMRLRPAHFRPVRPQRSVSASAAYHTARPCAGAQNNNCSFFCPIACHPGKKVL